MAGHRLQEAQSKVSTPKRSCWFSQAAGRHQKHPVATWHSVHAFMSAHIPVAALQCHRLDQVIGTPFFSSLSVCAAKTHLEAERKASWCSPDSERFRHSLLLLQTDCSFLLSETLDLGATRHPAGKHGAEAVCTSEGSWGLQEGMFGLSLCNTFLSCTPARPSDSQPSPLPQAQFRTRVQASLTLTRSAVPHINRASELPRKTVSSPAPPVPLVGPCLSGGVTRPTELDL